MTYDVTPILEALIVLCLAVITGFVIPYLKNKLGVQNFESMIQWVDIAVAAADQLFDSDQGKDKKEYVLNFLSEKNIKVNENELNQAIEAAVLKLHNALNK